MKKKLRLKRWASTVIYVSLVAIILVSMLFVSNQLDKKYGENLNLSYILKEGIDEDIPVVNEVDSTTLKPFDKDNVEIEINYYDKDESEELQEKSIILYKNTYMPNTGILYKSEEKFNVIATNDGTVTKISTDELLGNIIEITHNNNLITTYYSIDEIKVAVNDIVKQGDIIATSGKNNVSSSSDNMMLFEVNHNGENINPEKYYAININELQ